MSSRYAPSTTSRRSVQPERISTVVPEYTPSYDSYPRTAREGYTSPRSSVERVIPISTETYVNGVPVSSTRSNAAYDDYDSRNRRPQYPEHGPAATHRRLSSALTEGKSRLAPAILQDSEPRQRSPMPRSSNAGYYTSPAGPGNELRKVYSIDDDTGGRRESSARDTRRRDSADRYTYDTGKRKDYHLSGARPEASGAFEYTNAQGMYNDTEPAWRPRRGSLNRERPTSVYDPYDSPRNSARDVRPPPATRGLDKLKDNLGRSGSLRDPVRSPPRDRVRDRYGRDEIYDEPRPIGRYDPPRPRDYDDDDYEDRRRPSSHEDRRGSKQPVSYYTDRDVAVRGFGIRSDTTVDFTPHEHRQSISVDPLSRAPPESSRSGGASDPKKGNDRRENDDVRDHERIRERDRREKEREPFRTRERDDRDYKRDRERRRDDEHDYSDYDNDKASGSGTGETKRPSERERESTRDAGRRDRDRRARDYDRESDRERLSDEDRRRDKGDSHRAPPKPDTFDRSDDLVQDSKDDHHSAGLAAAAAAVTAAAASAAYGVHQHDKKKKKDERRESRQATVEDDPDDDERSSFTEPRETPASPPSTSREVLKDSPPQQKRSSPNPPKARERHYVSKDEPIAREEPAAKDEVLDADAEYRRRMQEEMDKLKRPAEGSRDIAAEESSKTVDGVLPSGRSPRERDHDRDRGNSDSSGSEASKQGKRRADRQDGVLEGSAAAAGTVAVIEKADKENRVRIVEPPREKAAPKGILRKPTEKFPDYPDAAREGVAPLKDSKKLDSVPEGAKWTKINRQLVNPQALEEGNERFEERKDVVIVLRVLTEAEVQEYADRTQEIRLEREERHRDRRDRRHHHHHRHHDDDVRDDED